MIRMFRAAVHFFWNRSMVDMTRQYLAPAKVNLCLHVLGKRPDGYHELAMLMQRVSLCDRIDMTLLPEREVRVRCTGVSLGLGEENIAGRAARRLLERLGEKRGVEIVIDKQIPVAAGLGGGSSDAATVLMGLNEMLGAGLSPQELMAEGGRLGADVPFFVFQRPAWATGIGDRLEEVAALPRAWYVLVNPGFAVSTAWVYQNLGLTSGDNGHRLPRFSGALALADLVGLLHNDLERVTAARYPQIGEIKARLIGLGAAGALMSGSGPTVFGLFASEQAACRAGAALAREAGWRVFVVRPI